jgi:hypothetical protein
MCGMNHLWLILMVVPDKEAVTCVILLCAVVLSFETSSGLWMAILSQLRSHSISVLSHWHCRQPQLHGRLLLMKHGLCDPRRHEQCELGDSEPISRQLGQEWSAVLAGLRLPLMAPRLTALEVRGVRSAGHQ